MGDQLARGAEDAEDRRRQGGSAQPLSADEGSTVRRECYQQSAIVVDCRPHVPRTSAVSLSLQGAVNTGPPAVAVYVAFAVSWGDVAKFSESTVWNKVPEVTRRCPNFTQKISSIRAAVAIHTACERQTDTHTHSHSDTQTDTRRQLLTGAAVSTCRRALYNRELKTDQAINSKVGEDSPR